MKQRGNFFLILWFLLIIGNAFSQAPDAYVVTFTDKHLSPYSIDSPQDFLSPKAIEKRQRYNISVTEEDLPINPLYINAITSFETVKLLAQSKWMNYVIIQCDDQTVLDILQYYPFVDQIKKIHLIDYSRFSIKDDYIANDYHRSQNTYERDTTSLSYYGTAAPQIAVHNGHLLHNQGYKGEGMLIVLLDNGFNRLDSLTLFNSLHQNQRLKGVYDAAHQSGYNPFRGGAHGTSVLSIMAVEEPYRFVGTAPHADYVLIRTEMTDYEDILEEYFWVVGAEYADSIGADVVNSSLGYTYFDKTDQNHVFPDLDGKHSVASIAATKLVQKGCIVSIAAGNEGDKSWYYISVPSDAPAALCVAAMNSDSVIADFSSCGSKLFLSVKPDIATVGWQTAYCSFQDSIAKGNGTSLASPVNAGLCACLWQAFPQKTNREIMDAVRQSAHMYANPDTLFGYGIPDFKLAYDLLLNAAINESEANQKFYIYPNPTRDKISISIFSDVTEPKQMVLFDLYGKILQTFVGEQINKQIDVSFLSNGVYFLRIIDKQANSQTLKFIKY